MSEFNQILPLMIIRLLSILLLLPSLTFADQIATWSNDQSIQQYQRKAIWLADEASYASRKTKALVTYCGFKEICLPLGQWTLKLDSDDLDDLNRRMQNTFDFNRFDKFAFSKTEASLKTPNETFIFQHQSQSFKGKKRRFSQLKEDLANYLKKQNKPVLNLLNQSIQNRALAELNREEATAATTELKTAGLNQQTIRQLMETGFAFAVHFDKPNALIHINQTPVETKFGRIYQFRTSVTASVKMTLVAYQFNPINQSFEYYDSYSGRSGLFNAGHSYDLMPSASKIQMIYAEAFSQAAADALAELEVEVRKDPAFRLKSRVILTEGLKIETDLHAGLDLRIGGQWQVSRLIDGKREKLAIAKVVKVAEAPSEQTKRNSVLRRLKGTAEEGDQLMENPWQGIQHSVSFEHFDLTHNYLAGYTVLPKANSVTAIRYGRWYDLGYRDNDPDKTERWLELSGALGFSENEIRFLEQPDWAFNAPLYLDLKLSLSQHYDVWATGLGFEPHIGAGMHFLSASTTDPNGGEDIQLSTADLSLHAGASLQWTLDSFAKLKLTFDYPLQLIGSASLRQENKDLPDYGNGKTQLEQSYAIGLGFQWNL